MQTAAEKVTLTGCVHYREHVLHESNKDSLDSVLGVVTALQLDGRGFSACLGQKIVLFSEIPRLVL